MPTPSPILDYGVNQLWASPVKRVNLLKDGTVDEPLHEWLERYADSPRLVSGSQQQFDDTRKLFMRYDTTIFDPPATPELARIKAILIEHADQFARETICDPLPEHEKSTITWFVVQHQDRDQEAVSPHYHEGGDFSLVYYLAAPGNGSAPLVIIDPRGAIDRGALVFGRRRPAITYHPTRGDLLIMPRYLMHYTTTNTDTAKRKVVVCSVRYERPRQAA